MELHCGMCKVRSWQHGDIYALARHADNRKIWVHLRDRFPHPYTRADARNWIETSVSARPETQFAIDVSGEAVGGIGVDLNTDVERYSAEVGYWLGETFWGRGLCTAALRETTRYAVEKYGLNRIVALPFSENLPSIRVLEKAGYRRECLMRQSAFKDGRFLDQALYVFLTER